MNNRPTGAALLQLVANAYLYAFPAGTRGAAEDSSRSNHPIPGDLVVVLGTIGAPPEKTIGWLLGIKHNANEYLTEYLIECLDGSQVCWKNVRLRAIPVGNQFDYADERKRWQP